MIDSRRGGYDESRQSQSGEMVGEIGERPRENRASFHSRDLHRGLWRDLHRRQLHREVVGCTGDKTEGLAVTIAYRSMLRRYAESMHPETTPKKPSKMIIMIGHCTGNQVVIITINKLVEFEAPPPSMLP